MTSQNSSDASASKPAAASPFEGLGAGFDFFNEWMKSAGSGMPNFLPGGAAASAQAPSWLLPTLDAKELEKRIRDLQAVKFWLEQNAQMVAATVQTLEVQRMTLETLKSMNLSADAIKASLNPSEDEASADERATVVNPMAWWDTLSQQFTQMTKQAMEQAEAASAAVKTAAKTTGAAKKTGTRTTAKRTTPAGAKTAKAKR